DVLGAAQPDLGPASSVPGCLRAWPHALDAEGFFVSCFRKAAGTATKPVPGGALEEQTFRLLDEDSAEEVRELARSAQRLGFWPPEPLDGRPARRLALQEDGRIFLLPGPELGRALQRLEREAEEPGVLVARRDKANYGDLQISEELLLLAGDRAQRSSSLDEGEWRELVARMEGDLRPLNWRLEELASRGDVAGAEKVLADMRSGGIEPNLITLNMLAKARARSGEAALSSGEAAAQRTLGQLQA
ncbi:unnamed protein product, partial [Polarella glacialis]